MKNILIPTDFSTNARNAIRYAISYHADIFVNFYFLHSTALQTGDLLTDEFQLTLQPKTDVQKRLQEEIQYAQKLSINVNHQFFSILQEQPLINAIRATIDKKQIDYIIMGTRGESDSPSEKVGSNTYEVISKVKCPTIIIPENITHKNFHHIGLVTDYNNWNENRMFTSLFETLLYKKAELHILEKQNESINWTSLQQNNKNILTQLFKKVKYDFHTLSTSELNQTIQDIIDQLQLDMIVLVGRNINFIQRLVFKPESQQHSYRFKVPFLILHD